MPADAELQQRKTKNQPGRPKAQQHEQREWPVISQKALLPRWRLNVTGNLPPGNPGTPVEPCRELELPGYSPRQHNGLKRIQQHDADDDEAENNRRDVDVITDDVKAHADAQ